MMVKSLVTLSEIIHTFPIWTIRDIRKMIEEIEMVKGPVCGMLLSWSTHPFLVTPNSSVFITQHPNSF